MIFNCEFFYLEAQIPEETIAGFLSRILGDTVTPYANFDLAKSDFGSIICEHHEQGFATEIKLMTERASPNEVSVEDIALALAKQYQTKVVTDLPSDHRWADIPVCWQMFDADGTRYYVEEEDKGIELDAWDDEVDVLAERPFIIVLQQPWPGTVTNDDDDDDDEGIDANSRIILKQPWPDDETV